MCCSHLVLAIVGSELDVRSRCRMSRHWLRVALEDVVVDAFDSGRDELRTTRNFAQVLRGIGSFCWGCRPLLLADMMVVDLG